MFSELLPCIIERFGDAVGIECKCIAGKEPAFLDWAIPFFEESHHGTRGIEPFKRVIAAEKKTREMAAIHIAQAPLLVGIFGKEERGVGAVGRILVKKLVYGAQKALWLIQGDCALAAEVGLQIGHQKSRSDSFSCDVAVHHPEPLSAQIKEVVVITTDLASLNAHARVFECLKGRERLGKE